LPGQWQAQSKSLNSQDSLVEKKKKSAQNKCNDGTPNAFNVIAGGNQNQAGKNQQDHSGD